jgi:stearoyl-CoA 9-desaturase NADPH oxidoreductase
VSASASAANGLPSTAGWLQRLAAPVVDPEVFDFWVQHLNPAWSWSRPLATIVERRVEARDTVTLVLKPNGHVGGFLPGQHVNVSAQVNGRRVTRSYSLTNVPSRSRRMSITVKRVEGGALSTHLVQQARVGDVLGIGPAFGEMTLPAQPQGRWLFLAAGSGITPLMGLTRALAAQNMPVELTLLYWVKTHAELCFLQELRALSTRFPRFRLQVIVTHEAPVVPGEAQGLISAQQLAQLVPGLSEQQVFACGPGGFIEAARGLCEGTSQAFVAEGFTPAAPVALPAATDARMVRVTLQRTGRELQLSTGLSLLDALEAEGLNPPSGCRMGVCHSCVCPRVEGTTQDMQSGDTQSEGNMAVRLCVSRACTDLTLDL